MYKRALMLTAATVALLSGQANAASSTTGCDSSNTTDYTDITKQITVPVCTLYANGSAAGNITFESNGSLSISASASSNGTIPAIEINSNNTVTLDTGSKITFTGVSSAIGVKMDQGFTGEFISQAGLDMTGNGTGKVGIQIGSTNITTNGTFTGVVDSTYNLISSTDLTAIALAAGSSVKVQGDGSYGIHLLTGDTLDGDIYIGGAVLSEMSNLNATTASAAVTAIEIGGNMTGNILVNTGGSVTGLGAGGRGIVLLGNTDGYIENLGSIEALGTTTPTSNKTNASSGAALAISGNLTGGIYNGGPIISGDSTATAIISSDGPAPTLTIQPGFDSITAVPINIGTFVDKGVLGDFSLINRGTISSAPDNVDVASTAISIQGSTAANDVTLTGILNAGSITASATNDVNVANTTLIAAAGIFVGGNVTINNATVDGIGSYAITNTNQSGTGVISAKVTGAKQSAAYGIDIAVNATVPSLYNSGNILAEVLSTDSTISVLRAYGIYDQSGTLTNIYNNGSITAVANASVNGTIVPLDNHENIAYAIWLGAATSNITLTNTGKIIGDVVLGSGDDTVTVIGTNANPATITGNIQFGGGSDTLMIGSTTSSTNETVTGDILETLGGKINITIGTGGTLIETNNGLTTDGLALPSNISPNLQVSNLTVAPGGTLGLTLSDAFNINSSSIDTPVVQASLNTTTPGYITLSDQSVLKMNFGGFISTGSLASNKPAEFIIFDTLQNNLTVADPTQIQAYLESGIPWLFTGSACAYNVTNFTACDATVADPAGSGHSDIILTLNAKDPGTSTANGGLGLHGYALKMFNLANLALIGDSTLGAAVINAGALSGGRCSNSNGTAFDNACESQLYQKIYSAFAPDVTGSARAIAISITDQASGIVGARQRTLRMYAGQDGDLTLWGQEFGQRLSVPNKVAASGYNNTGFGFALGADAGDIQSGRYGAALTFYAGDTREKTPRLSKTTSEWYMLTGYQDWRGKGLFFDSQINIGYGNLDGKRTFPIPDSDGTTRVAQGKRSSELASAGFTTGAIFNSGGTVFIPQLSVDGLTMREEKYTETGGGPGMDLHVESSYADSLRAFLGADLRQDLKIGDYFLQPEMRAGYRYDFINGAAKLKVNFAGDPKTTPAVDPGQQFTITGPDPAKGNLVAGGGIAITTDAWSVGVNYDYIRGFGGTKGTDQTAMLTLLGRI